MLTSEATKTPNAKIRPIDELVGLATALRQQGKTVVHCHGLFDLLHIGVIRHFELARELADVLVVTVTADEFAEHGPLRALFDQEIRAETVAAVESVDFVAVSPWPLTTDAIQALRPNVYAPWREDAELEEEHVRIRAAEEASAQAVGGRVVYLERTAERPRGLLQHLSPSFPTEASTFLSGFAPAHSATDILRCLDKAQSQRVLFVGETIIDEYQYCETLGKSGKEPILAVRYVSAEKFAGGILATANQAAAFCDHVGVLSLLGTRDSHEEFIREKLSPHVDASFLYMAGAPTIVKRRIVEIYPFQKLFEVYVMEPEIPDGVSHALCSRLKTLLPNYDVVVVTDYGHGVLTPEVVDLLCSSDKFLAVNTQTNAANQGFNTVSKYSRADFVCISEKEIRLEARNRRKDLRLILPEIARRLACRQMLVTQGKSGCMCYGEGYGFMQIPSFTKRIVDRVGAGDAVLAVTSLIAAQQAPTDVIGFVGNAVGAQAVEIVGNRDVVGRASLYRQIETLLR